MDGVKGGTRFPGFPVWDAEAQAGNRGRNREDDMKFVMILAVFGAITALFALIGLSDPSNPAYQGGDRTISYQ